MSEPPNLPEAEAAVLSACLLDGGETVEKCLAANLTPAAFYTPANAAIYGMILAMHRAGEPTEADVLVLRLKNAGKLEDVGGMDYVLQVSTAVPTTAKTDYYIRKLRELGTLRKLIEASMETIEKCHEIPEDFTAFIDATESRTLAATEEARSEGETKAADTPQIADDLIADMAKIAQGLETTQGRIRLGIDSFDREASLIEPEELVVIGARPSVGKSAIACHVANTALADGKRVAIFTLETSAKSVLARLAAQRTEVNVKAFAEEFPDKQKRFMAEVENIGKSGQLKIFDKDLTLDSIAARCRILAKSWHPELVVIDYLNIIRTSFGKSQYERITHISTEMIALRKTLDCALIVLAQFNRSPASEGRAPTMADFRDSGKIEEDAHRIIALHRPAKDDTGHEQDQSTFNQLIELHQLKNREGPCAFGRVRFVPKYTKFIA